MLKFLEPAGKTWETDYLLLLFPLETISFLEQGTYHPAAVDIEQGV